MSAVDDGLATGMEDSAIWVDAEAPDGWLTFAVVLFIFVGIWNIFEGSFALLRAAFFVGEPAAGPLWGWALVWIGLGILSILVATGLVERQSWARWVGLTVALVSGLSHLASFSTYPWWSGAVIVMDVIVVLALTARWREPATA